MTLKPGTKLGRYEILGPLGAGGMGEVYRARDERLQREVALKVLPAAIAHDAERLQRFEREASAASALNHPGILTVYDFCQEDELSFLVTELLEGESLRERLGRGALPTREALEYAAQAAQALAAVHAKGIIHRDLKPENLFLTHDGRIKILDFGIALQLAPLASADDSANTTIVDALTQPGQMIGTVGYMAPEQARGQAVDARTDLFALGCVLYEMLTGQSAFARGSHADTLKAILDEDPLAQAHIEGTVGEEEERVLRHCLEKDPAKRFQSAGDAAFAFKSLLSASGTRRTTGATEPAGKKTGFPILPIAAVVLIAALAISWVLLGRKTKDATPPGTVRSIAVLPFVSGDQDSSLEYLGDGIAETLIGRLSPLEDLEVLARTTTFRFKGKDVDPLQVGRTLKVNAIVSGHVEVVKGRVQIGAELVDVASGAQLWGERFDRPFSDLFEVEENVAREIGQRLSQRLGKVEDTKLITRPTASDEAYRLYLKGRHLWYQRTLESVQKSTELFRQAVELDPEFALAWNGLGDAYTVGWAGYQDLPLDEAYTRGERAVRRALELDDKLAEAHTSLAFLLFERHWDFAGAEREFQRSLELDPGNAYTHQSYGEYLYCVGRFDESMTHLQRALQLDPLSEIVQSVIGWSYLTRRDTQKAIAQFESILKREPGFIDSQVGLTLTTFMVENSESERAASLLDMARAVGQDTKTMKELASANDEGGLQALLTTFHELQQNGQISGGLSNPLYILWIDGLIGQKDKALQVLETMYADHSPGLSYAKTSPVFDPIRDEPRFQEILAEMNFPKSSGGS